MREQGFELGGGQAELAHTSFRVGHMGDHTVAGLDGMLDVLERVLQDALIVVGHRDAHGGGQDAHRRAALRRAEVREQSESRCAGAVSVDAAVTISSVLALCC